MSSFTVRLLSNVLLRGPLTKVLQLVVVSGDIIDDERGCRVFAVVRSVK